MSQPTMMPHEIAALYEPGSPMPMLADDMLEHVRFSYDKYRHQMIGGTVLLSGEVTVQRLIRQLGPRLRCELKGDGLLGPYFSATGRYEQHGLGVWVPLPAEQIEEPLHRRTVIKRRPSVVE